MQPGICRRVEVAEIGKGSKLAFGKWLLMPWTNIREIRTTKNFFCFAVCCQQKVKHVLEDIKFYINN